MEPGTVTDGYQPVVTRLPEALEAEREEREAAEALLREQELARVKAEAEASQQRAEDDAAKSEQAAEADRQRLADEP